MNVTPVWTAVTAMWLCVSTPLVATAAVAKLGSRGNGVDCAGMNQLHAIHVPLLFVHFVLTNVKLAWQTVMPMLFALTPQAVSPAHAAGDMKELGQHALVRDHRNPFLYQDLMDRKLNDIPVAVSMGATKSNGGSVANSLVFHSGK